MIKMKGRVKFSKDKIMSFIINGYRVKVGEKSHMFFEKEDDYLDLFNLEKRYVEFYNNLFFGQNDETRLNFLMKFIKKCIKSLPRIEIVVYYDDNETENSFLEKFPNFGHLNTVFNKNNKKREIYEKMEYIDNDDLKKKYAESRLMLEEKIKVKYIIKNERRINNFNRCYDAGRM